jgi:hypothetical protein
MHHVVNVVNHMMLAVMHHVMVHHVMVHRVMGRRRGCAGIWCGSAWGCGGRTRCRCGGTSGAGLHRLTLAGHLGQLDLARCCRRGRRNGA